jgi:hypothetical protein
MAFSGINHVLPEQLFKASIVVKVLLIRNMSGLSRESLSNYFKKSTPKTTLCGEFHTGGFPV